jgi:uroporphyrin-3 C-methyltransferase
MSEEKTEDGNNISDVKEQDDAAPDSESVDAEPDDGGTTEIEALSPAKSGPGRMTTMLALLAFIISVAAAGSIVYERLKPAEPNEMAEQVKQAEAAVNSLSSSLNATRDTLEQLQGRLSGLSDADAATRSSVDELENQFRNRLRQIESLPARINNLENSVASIQGISSGVRDTWLLAEAEYYMQIANAQLQLAGNPQLAVLALRLADERVEQLADPALIEVRRALSDELQWLEVMGRPDIEGITLTLASLASVVESLPLREQLPMTSEVAEAPVEELSGWDRAVAALQRTMSSVVSVRRTDEKLQPLVAPEAQYFLRANLALQLQAARLALLRNEQTIYQQSLDDAASWINEYYDTDSAPVTSALQTMAEIRERSFAVEAPDISGSLRLLRQLSSLSTESTAEPAQ